MRHLVIIIFFCFNSSFSFCQGYINLHELLKASALLKKSVENGWEKPIFSKKCFDEAKGIISSNIVLLKKYKYDFKFSSEIVSLRCFRFNIGDYFSNYDLETYNDIKFEYQRQGGFSKYPTSEAILEKLENLTTGSSYTATFQIIPGFFSKEGFSIYQDSESISIYVKILDIVSNRNIEIRDSIINSNALKIQKEAEDLRIKQKLEAEEKARLELEKQRKIEADRLSRFLKIRKDSIFNYESLNFKAFSTTKDSLERKLEILSKKSNIDSIIFKSAISIIVDTSGKSTPFILSPDAGKTSLESSFYKYVSSISLPKVYSTDYPSYSLSAIASYHFSSSFFRKKIKVYYFDKDIKLKYGDAQFYSKYYSLINNKIVSKGLSKGQYNFYIEEYTANSKTSVDIVFNDFKGLGGPSCAWYSLLLPGLGDKFVTGKFPIGKTIGILAFEGIGMLLKSQSRSSYNKYMLATTQANIDKYYNKANILNQCAWSVISVATIFWIADIAHVSKLGSINRRNNKITKSSLKL